jgi:hypothetical protein
MKCTTPSSYCSRVWAMLVAATASAVAVGLLLLVGTKPVEAAFPGLIRPQLKP